MENFDPVGGGYIAEQFVNFFSSPGSFPFLAGLYYTLKAIAFVLIPVLLVVNIWLAGQISPFRPRFRLFFRPADATQGEFAKKRWEEIAARLESANDAEWSLAVIEADNLVDDILKRIGLAGETMMERLSRINVAEFPAMQELKEAHHVRNNIAHTPGYKISRLEAENVMRKYRKVLEDLEVI
ncbi:MAG: hypothetical protein AAB904_01605 [Patescibacteria group bacterium]